MDHVIKNRSARILLVEPNSGRRGMLRQGMRDIGFNDVTQLASLEDSVRFIETQEQAPDWVITSLYAKSPVNGLSFLGLCALIPSLRKTRVSFLCKPEEDHCLSHAYEMGLFSSHKTASDTTSQMKEFEQVFKAGERYQWHDPLIAASFLRKHLQEAKLYDDMVHLEKSLLSIYHDVPALVLDLAQALYRQDRKQAALLTISRAPQLSPEVSAEADALHSRIIKETTAGESSITISELYGLRTMIAIDPDEHVTNQLEKVGADLGFEKCHGFANGQRAWEFMQENKITPDLMVMEWKIPGLSGNQLVQRLRKEGSEPFSLVVYSSLVKSTSDRVLLKELGISEVIVKPVEHKKLKQILESVITEDKSPKEVKSSERLIRQHLLARKFNDAKQLFDDIESKGGFPDQIRLELEATMSFYQGKYQRASQLAVEAMHIGGQTLTLLNLLGKIYMKLRKFDEANRFFDKAKEISPNNIERLTMIAESHAEQGHVAEAQEQIEKAKVLDSESEIIAESEAKVALAAGDVKRATALANTMENITGIMAFMNNRAVALVNQEKYKEATELYVKAIKSMGKKDDVLPIILYNMALAFIKQGDLKNAQAALQRSILHKQSKIFQKAASLAERTNFAIREGTKLKLRVSTSAENEADAEKEEFLAADRILPTATGINRGDMRLHLVFQSSLPLATDVTLMVQTIPRFKDWV